MSAVRDALNGVKSLLLLQENVKNLETQIGRQRDAIDDFGDDFVALDKRVVRIETMIEMSAQRNVDRPRIGE